MKTYENESMFVANFARDAKQGIKENGKFEAVVNNISVVVTNMDNNNASKVTIYTATINGVAFQGSITALKKRLNVTFKKEYNRSSEAAKTANTKVAIKTDEELKETAKTAAKRIKDAVETLTKYGQKYDLCLEQLTCGEWSFDTKDGRTIDITVEQYIFAYLQEERNRAKAEAEKREAEKREAEEKREAAKAELLAKIAEASASGKMALVIDLSKELAKLTK